jgi:HEAT repeat protein
MLARDPEVQVRANAGHALARLDTTPADAIPPLIECTLDANDGLRMNAAMALRLAPAVAVGTVMQHLVADPNSPVRLIAAGSLLSAEPGNTMAAAVVVEALSDPALRVRKAALELVESLGAGGAAFLEEMKKRAELEGEADLRDTLARIVERLGSRAALTP